MSNITALQEAHNFSLVGVNVPAKDLMSKGVYMIKCLKNGRFYIGATADCFAERWQQHQLGLCKFYQKEFAEMTSKVLHLDFVKFGQSLHNLEFSILKNMPTATEKEIFAEESRLIELLSPFYNLMK